MVVCEQLVALCFGAEYYWKHPGVLLSAAELEPWATQDIRIDQAVQALCSLPRAAAGN